MLNGLIIAIDGPAGSGKSTSAKMVAEKLGYLYIDTGAMYRAITFLALSNNLIGKDDEIVSSAKQCDLKLKFSEGNTRVELNGKDITSRIRSTEVNQFVSDVSKIKEIRKILVEKQREMSRNSGGVVMEGRDISTVVFPDADVKIFLTASLDIRAKRRVKDFMNNGEVVALDDIKKNISTRDAIDSGRDDSPLIQAPDAFVIDTTNVTIDEQVSLILEKVKQKADEKKLNLK